MCERLAVIRRMWTRFAIALLAGLVFLGCGHSGFVHDANSVDAHEFRMEISAQRYVRSVSGAASTAFVLCAIPTSGGAYRSAMAALHAEAQLKTNEVLANIREDHTFLTLLLYCEDDLILSADVYEVVPALAPAAAQGELASNFPAPALRPSPSDSFEPADPYVPPSNPYPPSPSAHTQGDAGPRARDPEVCERAHEHLTTDLPGVFHTIFPDARFVDAPAKAGFVAACVEQVDDVQLCLQSTFLKAHLAPCRAAFRDMTPEQRTRLFGTFLREW